MACWTCKAAGAIAIWELAGNETDCMIGYHSVSVLADAIAKGYHTDTRLPLKPCALPLRWRCLALATTKNLAFGIEMKVNRLVRH